MEVAATAAASAAISQAVPQAPGGHRQPSSRNIPARLLRDEPMIDRSETEFDRTLQICRRC